jgi:hemerythrin-like domain-containing protein
MQDLTVTSYLGEDHRRLDAIVEEVGQRLREKDFPEAARRFGEFVSGLNRHIEAEEHVLFPAFEELTGASGGPTAVMRGEHIDIRGLMDAVTTALRDEVASSAEEALRALVQLLASHNHKEERMLYPMTDNALGSADARAALVRTMRDR